VLGIPVAGAVYQVVATVGAWLHVGGPATSGSDYYLAANAPVALVLCNEDVVSPNVPVVHANFSAAGTVCAAQMALPNLQARFTGLGLPAEAALPVDAPQASGGRQGVAGPVEAANAPGDSAVNVRNSP